MNKTLQARNKKEDKNACKHASSKDESKHACKQQSKKAWKKIIMKEHNISFSCCIQVVTEGEYIAHSELVRLSLLCFCTYVSTYILHSI